VTTALALLQPPPECVALFDEVVVLQRGRVAFKGHVVDAVAFFFEVRAATKKPSRQDAADYLVDVSFASRKDLGALFERARKDDAATPAATMTTWPSYYRNEFTLPLSTYAWDVLNLKFFSSRAPGRR